MKTEKTLKEKLFEDLEPNENVKAIEIVAEYVKKLNDRIDNFHGNPSKYLIQRWIKEIMGKFETGEKDE